MQEQLLGEQSKELADEIRTQAEKLDFLIQSLVKISRLETGTFQFAPSENDIDMLISSAIEQITPKADSKGMEIVYAQESHTAKFDRKWTQEALFNILDNAVKYSAEQSSITVTVQMFEMFVCISVKDQGIGIPENELPRIFGRFYRGQNVREESGVGIGLYLSRQIIEEQGGYIAAESVPQKGSVFKIFLPR